MNQIKYEYRRSISRVLENDDELFVGYISLTKYRLVKEQPYVLYERTEQLNSNLVRSMNDLAPDIVKLPEGDIIHELTEEMYLQLANAFLTNHKWLWTYMASI